MSFVTMTGKLTQILIVIIIAILIAGCSTTGGVKNVQNNPSALAEERLQQESHKFVKKVATGSIFGAVIGGAAGATLGAVIVAASGSKGDIIWQLAAAGAATGAVIGGVSAVYFDEKQKQYAKEEDRINSMIADVKKDNSDVVEYQATVHEYISSSKEKIAYIKQQYRNKSGEIKSAQKELEKFQESQKLIAGAVQFMREKKKAYAQAVAMQNKISGTQSTASLDDQISDLEVNITHLEWEEKSLISALAISPAG